MTVDFNNKDKIIKYGLIVIQIISTNSYNV